MKTTNLFLTFCLVSGVSFAHAATTTPKKTADSQFQGTTSDVEVTRKIRERLMEDKSLSTKAQNVTIVTVGNNITLKGEVEKKDEISKVSSVAQEYAIGKTITNELKVTR
jgi:hyperosmotically inducible protein